MAGGRARAVVRGHQDHERRLKEGSCGWPRERERSPEEPQERGRAESVALRILGCSGRFYGGIGAAASPGVVRVKGGSLVGYRIRFVPEAVGK